jgi:hypothetical protein
MNIKFLAMEVMYKLRADELTPDLLDSIQKLFGRNEIVISVSGEPDEAARMARENPIRPGEFQERIQNIRPGEQMH